MSAHLVHHVTVSRPSVPQHLALGEVTQERLASVPIPSVLKVPVQELDAAYAALKQSAATFKSARAAHRSALAVVHAAHADVSVGLDGLAASLVQAAPETRHAPFAPFGVTTKKVTHGGRARMATQVADLVGTVLASKPSKSVRDAANQCAAKARALQTAHAALTPHIVALKEARVDREAKVLAYQHAHENAKNVAQFAWRAQPERFIAVFGPVEHFRLGIKRRKGKAASSPATGSTPPAQPPATAAPPAGAAEAPPAHAAEAPAAPPAEPAATAANPAS